jgi:hypothetical protein
MSSASREEKLRAYAGQASERLVGAGKVLAGRQTMGGPARGNVPPWPGSEDLDFHGTLSAIWVWSRAQVLSANDHFSLNIAAAWDFVNNNWDHFIPLALGPEASDEAAYDCAMVLRAALADPQILHSDRDDDRRRDRAASAARLLGAYVNDLESPAGREFRDPGFLAWSLGEYARVAGDRGLSSMVRRFVEAAYGMKSPPPFSSEPAVQDDLFDFSCTTATRVLAVLGAEGPTPFIGAWLRERVASAVARTFVARPMDENTWNACAAVVAGRAYAVSTDPVFFELHGAILSELDRRAEQGALGRQPGFSAETAATFYYAMAVDAPLAKG